MKSDPKGSFQNQPDTSVPRLKPGRPADRSAAPAETARKRVSWSGGLSQEELARPGGILLAMLVSRANELGDSLGDLAKALNVTYGYIAQLRNGFRKPENISDSFATACAAYLGVPRLAVLLAAGRVRPLDVYEDPHEVMASLPHALKFMQSDGRFAGLMPPEVFEVSSELQLFIVTLYEAATDRKLLPGHLSRETVAKQIEHFQAYRAKLLEELAAHPSQEGSDLPTSET